MDTYVQKAKTGSDKDTESIENRDPRKFFDPNDKKNIKKPKNTTSFDQKVLNALESLVAEGKIRAEPTENGENAYYVNSENMEDRESDTEKTTKSYFSPELHILSVAEAALSDCLYQVMFGVHPQLSDMNPEEEDGTLDPDQLKEMIMRDCALSLISRFKKHEIDHQTMIYASMMLSPMLHNYWPSDKDGEELVREHIPQVHLDALKDRWEKRQ